MELQESIATAFAEGPHLQALFLFDEAGEWAEAIDSLDLPGVHCVIHGGNDFALKAGLHTGEWADQKVFIYCRQRRPETQDELADFALLDVLVANAALAMDDIERFGQRYGLNKEAQRIARPFMKELQKPAVQKAIEPLLNGTDTFDLSNLERALTGYLLKAPQPEAWPFLIARLLVISATAPEEGVKVTRRIVALGLEEALLKAIEKWLEARPADLSPNTLQGLLQKVKYNALLGSRVETAATDPYASLRIKHSFLRSQLVQHVNQMLQQPKTGPALALALENYADEIREAQLLPLYGEETDWGWMSTGLKWLLLGQALNRIPAQPAQSLSLLLSLKTEISGEDGFGDALNAGINACHCLNNIAGSNAHLRTPDEFIKTYTDSDYQIDQNYRLAIGYCQKAERGDLPENLFLDKVRSALNDAYDGWLEAHNRAWLQCVNAAGFDWSTLSTPKQWDFYRDEIENLDQKTVVIISDALRYEAAQELLSMLHANPKNVATMSARMAALPSVTPVGMSNLLPGKDRQFNDNKITVDGQPTEGVDSRRQILKFANADSDAIQYTALMADTGMSRQEIRDTYFKKAVFYIYHNVIDSRSDNRTGESHTAQNVTQALVELESLVRKLHNSYNVAKVFVTSDHGFLYQDKTVEDKDLETAPIPAGTEPLVKHKRFLMFNEEIKPELGYVVPLRNVSPFTDDAWVVIPASINRYRLQGAAYQFVHGGASLQELVVPVIESGTKLEKVAEKVDVKLLTTAPKIVSNVVKVDVFQEVAVDRLKKSRKVHLALYDDFTMVSERVSLSLEATSKQPGDRLFSITLSLKPGTKQLPNFKLRMFDEDDSLNALAEVIVPNQTLIQPDF